MFQASFLIRPCFSLDMWSINFFSKVILWKQVSFGNIKFLTSSSLLRQVASGIVVLSRWLVKCIIILKDLLSFRTSGMAGRSDIFKKAVKWYGNLRVVA
ncbi:hypothetical protein AMTR_s00145p00068230 [Amborella trichopoda]|uniref:Uncharacterized protein n=1 Tax=Amborella trichopoda TaxID=13333 RepID=W1PFV0_AMBTC|nr:hypothetical protein AMTR_s00145p00068230 [Amborella trichopoda]